MRAWSLLANSGIAQYAGNTSWSDDPNPVYRYDSNIPNHPHLRVGDIVVIRDNERAAGMAAIERIVERVAAKDGLSLSSL